MPHLLLRDYRETSYFSGDLLPVNTGYRIPYLLRSVLPRWSGFGGRKVDSIEQLLTAER